MENLSEINNKIENLNNLLDRKLVLLNQILTISENQSILFNNINKEDSNSFLDCSLKEKQLLIDQLISIDNMFFSIFESFEGSLNNNKDIFKNDIDNLQNKIKNIYDTDIKIRLQEEQNKQFLSLNTSNNLMNHSQKINTLKISKTSLLEKYKNNNISK